MDAQILWKDLHGMSVFSYTGGIAGQQNGDNEGKLWYNVNKVQTFLDEEQNYETFTRICDAFADGGY